ncbi:MAG: serine hydrolase [Blastocatellia bacterium]|nr:serine hydrolase [Blastocatellia bacterium]
MSRIKRMAVWAALALFLTMSARAQEAAPISSKLDEYLIAAAKQGFTGSALVAKDGKIIFSKGYGMANIEWDIPNTPQTKFRLGSITKQFTAASILLLQERGKLSVQDPICKFFDNCPDAWKEITIVILRNADYGDPNPSRVGQDLAAIVLGEKYEIPHERVAIKIDPKILDAYIGQYELAPNFIFTMIREGDNLMTQATGQPKFELFPESETKFFLKPIDAQVTFVKHDKGVVTHLILHQGGDRTAKKIK